MSITCFHGFSRSLTEEVFSSLNEERRLTRMGWNDYGIFDCFIRLGITLRSLQAKWNIQNILYSLHKVFRLFIYLIVWKRRSHGRITKKYKFKEMKVITPKREKVSSLGRLFLKMNFVTCRSTYHSSCYRIESRTSKNSDKLIASVYWESVICGCNLQCVNMLIIWVSFDKHSHIVFLIILTWSGVRS